MRIKVIAAIISLILLPALKGMVYAQDFETSQEVHVSGSPNPVGSGARALGMGGAFIGVADDATAASWNPGGLIQLETPEISIVLSGERLSEDRAFRNNPGASGEYHVTLYDINYFSLAYPFTWKEKNLIVSLNYQTLYNFNKKHIYDYTYRDVTASRTETDMVIVDYTIDSTGPRRTLLDTEGYLKALSPAIAVQLNPAFSLGFTLNLFHPSLGCKWDTDYEDNIRELMGIEITTSLKPPFPTDPMTSTATYSNLVEALYQDEFSFESSINPLDIFSKKVSYNLGFLWNINQYLTLGGVFKAPFKARIRYKESFGYTYYSENIDDPTDVVSDNVPFAVIVDEIQEMEMPASYGLGLAYRFSDQLSMDLDIYRTDWQDFLLRQASGRELSLITGQEISKSGTEPTHQVRLGAEYLFIKDNYIVPLRGGIFYDPEPTDGRPDAFYGFTLGGGIAKGSYVFDMAYQYRWGNNVRKVRLLQEEIFQDVRQHTVYASLIYHF